MSTLNKHEFLERLKDAVGVFSRLLLHDRTDQVKSAVRAANEVGLSAYDGVNGTCPITSAVILLYYGDDVSDYVDAKLHAWRHYLIGEAHHANLIASGF